MFADFQIGVDLARGDLRAVEIGISNLRRMPDEDGKADLRQAQLLMRRHQYRAAKELLTKLLTGERKGRFHIRSLRANAAAKDKDFSLAQKDLEFVRALPGRQVAALRIEVTLHSEQNRLDEAEAKLALITPRSPEDWLLEARIFELRSESPTVGISERQELRNRAAKIRADHNFTLEYEYEHEE